MLLNNSGIKTFFREHNVKMSRHVLLTLEEQMKKMLTKTVLRAQQNQRKTVFGRDV